MRLGVNPRNEIKYQLKWRIPRYSKGQTSTSGALHSSDYLSRQISGRAAGVFPHLSLAAAQSREHYLTEVQRGGAGGAAVVWTFYSKPSGLTSATGHAKDFKAKG